MASTRLSDVYNPLTFARRSQMAQIERNAFIGSGIAVRDPLIDRQFAQGGNIGELPLYNALTIDEPNYSTDDPAVNSTPAKVSGTKMLVRSAHRNKSWSTMDLTRELALEDPVGAITGRIGNYWATDDEKRIIQSALGVLADNDANDSDDMLVNVATDGVGAVADAERIGSDVVLNAKQTMGDHAENLRVLAIHSAIWTRLQKQNLVVYNTDPANANVSFPTYLGYRLVVDDSLPAVAGTNRITYTSILFAAGAMRWGQGRVITPSETERIPSSGNGGGETVLHSRINTIFHVEGFSFLSASVAGQSATYAELANAANWDRIVPRKLAGLAFIKTND